MSSKRTEALHLTFSFRLAALCTAFLAASFIILFTMTYHLVVHVVQTRDREVIRARTEQFRTLFQNGGVGAVAGYFDQQIEPHEPIFVRIIDRNGNVHFITVSHPLWELLDQEVQKTNRPTGDISRWNELAREESQDSWVVGTVPLSSEYLLQVGRSTTESRMLLSHLRRTGFRICVPAVLLSLVGGWLTARSALSPLRILVQTIHHILQTGDRKLRVPSQALRGELGSLSSMFNRVLDRNEMLIQSSRETLDNVAHDLRTPMTHLRNAAERALEMEEPDARVQREALADCMEESEQILRMLNALMDLSEASVGGMTLHYEPVNLYQLTEETIELYAFFAEERSVTMTNSVDPLLTVDADRTRLRQALGNLIDNALKYSDPGGDVIVTGTADGTHAKLSVEDHGCGIAGEHIGRIWDRLYRVESSRGTPGLGLGLSMVRAIAEAHGGTIDVQSRPGEGSLFTLRLPAHPADSRNPLFDDRAGD